MAEPVKNDKMVTYKLTADHITDYNKQVEFEVTIPDSYDVRVVGGGDISSVRFEVYEWSTDKDNWVLTFVYTGVRNVFKMDSKIEIKSTLVVEAESGPRYNRF